MGGVDQAAFAATYAVVDLDRSDVTAHLHEILANLDFVTLRDAKDERRAEQLAADGDVDAAIVLPAGMAADLAANGRSRSTSWPRRGPTSGPGRASRWRGPTRRSSTRCGLSVATAAAPGASAADVQRLVAAAQGIPPAATVEERSAESHVYSASTFFAIGMAVFFLFFTVEFGVRGLWRNGRKGRSPGSWWRRSHPSAILAGKAMASFAVGLASHVAAGDRQLGVAGRHWGEPLGVALLVLAGVFTAVAVTALATTLAKTPAQAGAYASIVAVVGGLLGGTFFPVSQAGALAYLRFLSPQGWLMAGFEELASGGAVAAALPAIAGTLAIGIACATIAWSRASKLVAR